MNQVLSLGKTWVKSYGQDLTDTEQVEHQNLISLEQILTETLQVLTQVLSTVFSVGFLSLLTKVKKVTISDGSPSKPSEVTKEVQENASTSTNFTWWKMKKITSPKYTSHWLSFVLLEKKVDQVILWYILSCLNYYFTLLINFAIVITCQVLLKPWLKNCQVLRNLKQVLTSLHKS